MASEENTRVFLLEEQVKSLSDELMQCQADKEFVWSLWKRLQVANPDLTQAVTMVVEREKQKAEIRDKKVLEILQTKDYMIQDLEQRVLGQQHEIDNLLQRKQLVDEDKAIMKKETTTLREKLVDKTEEMKLIREEKRRREEEAQRVMQALEEGKMGLASRCATLQADLEEERRQAVRRRDQGTLTVAIVKELEGKLSSARMEVTNLRGILSTKEQEVAAKEALLNKVRCEMAEVQALYRQSTQHAEEQSHLIRQLEGLNLDTQRVLRNQEEAHTADASSYQTLYKELSQSYQALVSSEAELRQGHQELSGLLAQRDQSIQQLQEQLQELQEQLRQLPAQQPTVSPLLNRQTNVKELPERADTQALRLGSISDPGCDPSLEAPYQALNPSSAQDVPTRRQQGAPVQRSRSLSPASMVEAGQERRRRGGGGGGVREAEQRIQDLEELLQLKTEESEELKRAHGKRLERLRLLQSSYRTVREQLRELEEASELPKGRSQRAQPWQLRQENSDVVWNELAYFKRLTRKLTTEKANLDEELDVLRVQAAMDRSTVKELHLCLHKDHQGLLRKVAEERRVRSSTPKKPCVSAEQMEESLKQMEELERRLRSLEEDACVLREEKDKLLEANQDLAGDCRDLRASLEHLRIQAVLREEAARAAALAQGERHRGQAQALEALLVVSRREAAGLQRQALKLRQELGVLQAARDYRSRVAVAAAARGGGGAGGRRGAAASSVRGKVKLNTGRLRGPPLQSSHRAVGPNQAISWQGHSPSPTKDEWEDMSADSSGDEDFSDSLNSVRLSRPGARATRKSYRYKPISNTEAPEAEFSRMQPNESIQDSRQRSCRDRGTSADSHSRVMIMKRRRVATKSQRCCSSSSLQQRVESLQRRVDALLGARKDGEQSERELRQANEKITAQLNSLAEKLCSSKQLTQKLTCDLAGVEQQKRVLEMELEQWRKILLPQQSPAAASESSSQAKAVPSQADPALQVLEAEVKLLQVKLKGASAEVTRLTAANKALRGQMQEKDDKLRQLQDKVSHADRDIVMKRQLVEDLKTRMKFAQETEKSYRGQMEELEKKVKSLSEEASNRRCFIDSLKRRLSVATSEKSQQEASCVKLKEDLQKREHQVETVQARLDALQGQQGTLQAQVGAGERAMAELQQMATRKMEGLAQQSTQAMELVERRLGLAYSQVEQLHVFIKALAKELLGDVHEVKQQLTKRRRRWRKARAAAAESRRMGPAAQSMTKAKCIAASILNMTESDLADMMDPEQMTENVLEGPEDQEWIEQLDHILKQKIPSAGQLMEAVRVKMKERKVLTEELAALATPVSENA